MRCLFQQSDLLLEDLQLFEQTRYGRLTLGAHPMRFERPALKERGVTAAGEIRGMRDGSRVRVAGAVICRQQPATAKGFVFLSLEDETGIVNAILPPALFEAARAAVVQEPYLVVEGVLQNLQGVASVKAGRIEALRTARAAVLSHDFC